MSNPDLDWALDMCSMFGRGGDDEYLFYAVIEGEPWSKSRPRFTRRGKGGTYQPRDDREAEQRLAWHLKAGHAERFPGNVMLACRFYRPNSQRIDADNLLKHVCDSATGILWDDDCQVTLTLGEIQLDRERPRTVIVAADHYSTLLRGDDRKIPCAHCGEPFLPPAGSRGKRFCSSECMYGARVTKLDDRECPQCGKTYKPKTATQARCSRECHAAWLTGRAREKAAPMSTCAECGKELAHRRGGRCRDCWRANPGFYGNHARTASGAIRIREAP